MSRRRTPLVCTALAAALALCTCDTPLPEDRDQDTFSPADGDCDDTDPAVHPGAQEVPYDGVDQDCDGADLSDVDGDGHDARAAGGQDCDDDDPAIHPGAEEVCEDGVDQDCNGLDLYCDDIDEDGDSYSVKDGDCDDDDPLVNPGVAEVPYNGKDDDCSAATPDDDLDDDGYPEATDCDDDEATVHPGATEIPYDGVDQDCLDGDVTDVDRDGYSAEAVPGGTDCDDERDDVNPAGVEVCGDGVDQDCVGGDLACSDVDGDEDGYSPNEGDCNDEDALINPGADEVHYNGKDDDCNAATPDDDLDQDGYAKVGGGDCDDTDETIHPNAQEVPYDGIDQDCVDGDLVDVDGDGFASDAVTGGLDCDDGDPAIHPDAREIPYDGTDQDCDESDFVTAGAFNISPSGVNDSYADGAAVASNGAGHLVAWSRYDGSAWHLEAQRIAPNGTKSGTTVAVYDEPNAQLYEVAAASDGTDYFVVFRSREGGLYQIKGRKVTAAGALGTTRTIKADLASGSHPAVAYSSGAYHVAWQEGSSIVLAGVDTDGAPLLAETPVDDGAFPYFFPALAAGASGNVLVTYFGGTVLNIHSRLFFPTGAPAGPQRAVTDDLSAQLVAYASCDGSDFLVSWVDGRDGPWAIYGQRVDGTSGAMTGGNFVISNAPDDQFWGHGAFCGGRHTVVFEDERYVGHQVISFQRVAQNGTLLESTSATNQHAYAFDEASFPQLTCGGDKLLVVWFEEEQVRGRLLAP